MRYLIALAALTLAGCATAPAKPAIPQVVQVVVTKYVPVPAALTQPCPIAELTTGTGFDALAVGHARKLSLEDCNDRLGKIRQLGNHP